MGVKSTPAACVDCAYLDDHRYFDKYSCRRVYDCNRYNAMAYIAVEQCALIPKYLEIVADTPRILAADMFRNKKFTELGVIPN